MWTGLEKLEKLLLLLRSRIVLKRLQQLLNGLLLGSVACRTTGRNHVGLNLPWHRLHHLRVSWHVLRHHLLLRDFFIVNLKIPKVTLIKFSHLISLHRILRLHDLVWIRRSHRIWIVHLIEARVVPIAHHVSTRVRSNANSTCNRCVLWLRQIRIHVIWHSHVWRVHSRRRSHLTVVLMRLLTRRFRLNLIIICITKISLRISPSLPVSRLVAPPPEVSAFPASFLCPRDVDFPCHPFPVLD